MTKQDQYKIIEDTIKTLSVWKDQFGTPYMTIKNNKNFPIHSNESKAHIRTLFSKKIKGNLKNIVEEALQYLYAKAETQGIQHETFLRTGKGVDGAIYLDVADNKGHVVKIDHDGWKVTDQCPIKFIQTAAMLPLPIPQTGGSFELLDSLLNIADTNDRHMIVSWLFNGLLPTGPYPILIIGGEQGSAKSFTTKLIKSLIDPSKAATRPLFSDDRNLMVGAHNNWILAFDNISKIDKNQADTLCRLATGAGFGVRTLYSNRGEEFFESSRSIIINGIGSLTDRSDIIERSIFIYLPTISPTNRKTEQELQTITKEYAPLILGCLLDVLSAYIKNGKDMPRTPLPRMADFAARVIAVEDLIGWEKGEFLKYYSQNSELAQKHTAENVPLIQGIRKLMSKRASWRGSATELLNEIRKFPHINERELPAPNKLGIERCSPALRLYQIEVNTKRTGNERSIHITKIGTTDTTAVNDIIVSNPLDLLKVPLEDIPDSDHQYNDDCDDTFH